MQTDRARVCEHHDSSWAVRLEAGQINILHKKDFHRNSNIQVKGVYHWHKAAVCRIQGQLAVFHKGLLSSSIEPSVFSAQISQAFLWEKPHEQYCLSLLSDYQNSAAAPVTNSRVF